MLSLSDEHDPMPTDARMTVRLDPATRRKVERLATKEGISMNEALNRLLREAPEEAERSRGRRRYRLKPRRVSFGFDISRARQLAGEIADAEALKKLLDER
jgi:hypothetical protein